MATIRREPRLLRAVILDLDETLLDRDPAWAYSVEEAVIGVTGRRVEARSLATEYRNRPWRHALAVLLDTPGAIDECEGVCRDIYERSAMKRLLVHEGMGMALDALRGASVEIGAISREPHAVARRQVDSTGLDRFLTVMSATPAGTPWDAAARVEECRSFLGWPPHRCGFVSHDIRDLRRVAEAGYPCRTARWVPGALETGFPGLLQPGDLASLLA